MQIQECVEYDMNTLLQTVLATVKSLRNADNVAHPAPKELKQTAERYGVRTVYGNYNFVSTVKNRSAWLTVYIGSEKVLQSELNHRQKEILMNAPKTVKNVHRYIEGTPVVCVERTMGDNAFFNPHCTLYVSVHRKEMIRLAYMIGQTLFPSKKTPGPELDLLYVPEWQEKDRQILVFPEAGVTYVLGSDYYGEAKKGFLRMAMWTAKQKGMLGVHAGAKIIKAKDRTGRIRRYGMILFGLSATGKTTHACHNHGLLEDGEGQEIVQDDVVFIRPDGSALGTERGFYLKTGYINPKIQPIIFRAAISHNTIFENVMVDYLGNVHFDDTTLTENGRAIIQRDDLGTDKSESVNLPPLSELDEMIIIFITRRNTVVPIASKLTIEQAAAAFMLGESVETSAGDPSRAGESVRETGTNPFIVGDESLEGNWFYDFLKTHKDKTQCYLLNTGGVGEVREEGNKIVKQATRVEIPEMAAIIRGIVRNSVDWKTDPYFDTLVPKNVNGLQMTNFDLSKFYTKEQIKIYADKLKNERLAWLRKFKELNPAVFGAVKL
ncbi:MAG: phosphoenolpyruvate carboxykinase [Candidatus Bathyarchaeota archaeon]|nr:phosphoenolpyruvate carboxykinase [Candidatus Bathyarchaeota archaeon]MDH5786865.1 phosphoenolpyruvate carboxykinase [Candidatus Bathyarchaeota archaeon]